MKKMYFLVIISMAVLSLSTVNAQVKAGLKIGADFSTIRFKVDEIIMNDSMDFKRLTSPRLGFLVEIPLSDELFIYAGADAALKGFKYTDEREKNEKWVKSEEMHILVSVNFPIMAGYKLDLDGFKVFGMVGPVIGWNTYTTNLYKANGNWDNSHLTIGAEPTDNYKPIDINVRLEAGIEISRFQFSASYTHGLSDLMTVPEFMTARPSVIGLSAAIKFGEVDGGRRGGHRRR